MQPIPCSIQVLEDIGEICWIIEISHRVIPQAALQLSALHNSLLSNVRFRDVGGINILMIDSDTITLADKKVYSTSIWFEALLRLFLNTALNGWTDTAHLDQTFIGENGDISITASITP